MLWRSRVGTASVRPTRPLREQAVKASFTLSLTVEHRTGTKEFGFMEELLHDWKWYKKYRAERLYIKVIPYFLYLSDMPMCSPCDPLRGEVFGKRGHRVKVAIYTVGVEFLLSKASSLNTVYL